MARLVMRTVRVVVMLAGVLAAALAAASASVMAAPVTGHSTGTLRDGATWIADVPANWNGTLLLYSHGYGPLVAADAPDPTTQAALLSMGYAMAGSSYDPNGSWWALGSAVADQFQTLSAVEKTVLRASPSKVYAFGTSMGGLVERAGGSELGRSSRRRPDHLRARRRREPAQPVPAGRGVRGQPASRADREHPTHGLHRRAAHVLRQRGECSRAAGGRDLGAGDAAGTGASRAGVRVSERLAVG